MEEVKGYRYNPRAFNAQQREAVLHKDGPMLVLAGAGSGKTRIIAHRIAVLVSCEQIPPSQIVAVSFTNKAANEMRHRVKNLIGNEAAQACRLSTFHALGAEILRHHLQLLGWRQPFAIIDTSDQLNVVRNILKDLHLDTSHIDPEEMQFLISRAKNAGCSPIQMPGMNFSPIGRTCERVYQGYQEMRKHLNVVDFDDLVGLPCEIFDRYPDVLQNYLDRWRYLLVDEYQDTNAPQFRLLKQLCGTRNNVMVVGDDDQSIYAFRGADSSHILHFPEQFDHVRVVSLEQNYRSTTQILQAANAVIAKNTVRHAKTLWCASSTGDKLKHYICNDEQAEARFISEQIDAMRVEKNAHFRDFAILYRVNPQSRPLEIELTQRRIPYRVVGGTSFFDKREIKDIVYFLRAIWSPNDELSLRRIVNVPRRGLSAGNLKYIDDLCKEENISFWEAIQRAVDSHAFSAPTTAKGRDFVQLIRRFHERVFKGEERITDIATSLVDELHYISYIQSSSSSDEQAQRRIENLEELYDSLRSFENTEGNDLFSFLQRIQLEPPQKGDDSKEDQVTLMTLHSSKGLEYPYVFMAGCEDGLLPHAHSKETASGLEEERRLCYVGITRAKQSLILTSCAHRMAHGETVPVKPSPFLKDIPEELIETFHAENSTTQQADAQFLQAKQRLAELKRILDKK